MAVFSLVSFISLTLLSGGPAPTWQAGAESNYVTAPTDGPTDETLVADIPTYTSKIEADEADGPDDCDIHCDVPDCFRLHTIGNTDETRTKHFARFAGAPRRAFWLVGFQGRAPPRG